MQNDQQGVFSFGIEQHLQRRHFREVALDLQPGLFVAFILAAVARIDGLEPHLVSRPDDQMLAIVHVAILKARVGHLDF